MHYRINSFNILLSQLNTDLLWLLLRLGLIMRLLHLLLSLYELTTNYTRKNNNTIVEPELEAAYWPEQLHPQVLQDFSQYTNSLSNPFNETSPTLNRR